MTPLQRLLNTLLYTLLAVLTSASLAVCATAAPPPVCKAAGC